MSKISTRVASRFIQSCFQIDGDPNKLFGEMSEAAQEAEFLHAADGQPHQVVAVKDDEHGMFSAGEVVYTSKGGPD